MRWLDGINDSMDMSLSKLQYRRAEESGMLQSMGLQRVRHDFVIKRQQKLLLPLPDSVYLWRLNATANQIQTVCFCHVESSLWPIAPEFLVFVLTLLLRKGRVLQILVFKLKRAIFRVFRCASIFFFFRQLQLRTI